MKALAPGKLVAWGEYAVLAGAPAVVMALDRYAQVELSASAVDLWEFSSSGFLTPGVHLSAPDFCSAPSAAFCETILKHWGYTELIAPFQLHTDTQVFFHAGDKLGIGSSAAVCTATYQALAQHLGRAVDLQEVSHIHHMWQGGKGSGLDIAASWHGGVIEFHRDGVNPWHWPPELKFRVFYTGQSASTAEHLGSFSRWREQADTSTLDDLCAASQALTQQFGLEALADYIRNLTRLDEAADLNIYTRDHLNLATLAESYGVLYKPCGAGGGDIGVALSYDDDALDALTRSAEQQQYVPLATEIAAHGVAVQP